MFGRFALLAGGSLLISTALARGQETMLDGMVTMTEGDVRVQALSPNLVRLEVRGPKGFENRPTFRVLQRMWLGMSGVSVRRVGGRSELKAPNWTVSVPVGAKDLSLVRVVDRSGAVMYAPSGEETSRVWLPAPGKVGRAWAFADAPRIVPAPQGATPDGKGDPNNGWDLGNSATDVYVFLPNGSYSQLRKDFLRLTGPAEMPPLFMLGLIDSKYHPYTDKEALDRVDQYRKRSIPLDVLTIDTDWRTNGSHGYTPDPKYFPDMPGFIRKAKAKGVRLMFNDHPEPQAAGALDPKEIDYRWAGLTKLMAMGMDVWWYDRNWHVGFREPAPGLQSHLWGMRVYQDATRRFRPNERPVIMANVQGIDNGTRTGPPDVAAHRFSVQWTGDTTGTWAYMRRAVENAVQGGVEGLNPWINDDLGGHNGTPSPELYVRFMQYGALCPIMRPHCTRGLERAPWAFGPEAERITAEYVRMRYRLMPTLYAAARESYDKGEPMVRRLDLDFPAYPEAKRDDQFLVGKDLLVAPVVDGGPKPFPAAWSSGTWKAEYFANETLKGSPVLTREEALPGFSLRYAAVAPEVPADKFSARWTGTVTNPSQDVVDRLVITSDDGVRVWVDGKMVLDKWGPRDSVVSTVPVAFRPGKSHQVRIDYQEIGGGQMMQLGLLGSSDRSPRRSLWVPPGTWTDLWTGNRLKGPKMASVSAPLGRMPMFARVGGIIPTVPQMQRTGESAWKHVRLEAFAGADGSATLYEDDGHTIGYKSGAARWTQIGMKSGSGKSVVTIAPAKGTYPGAVAQRSWTVRLHVPKGQQVTAAAVNGKTAKWTRIERDTKAAMPFGAGAALDGAVVEVQVPATSVGRAVTVSVATK